LTPSEDINAPAAPESSPERPDGGACAGSPPCRRRRRHLALVAVACVAVALLPSFLFYRRDPGDIFRALPGRTVAAAYLRGMASEERAALRHAAVREAIAAFGADPDETLEDNSGLYWTLFWLTGENSCLGVVPKAGECAGLGAYLAGASFTGWKARALELLWRVKWVPGLGRLRTTARGTRYMEFPHAHELFDNGIVLGLDIVRGNLVAVLAQDPDLVLELSARLSDSEPAPLASCFATVGDIPPWERIPKRHRLWIDVGATVSAASEALAATPGAPDVEGLLAATPLSSLSSAGTVTLDLESFSVPGSDATLSFASTTLEAEYPAGSVPAALPSPPVRDGTFLSASFACRPFSTPPPDMTAAGSNEPSGAGTFCVSGAPNASHLAIVQVPSLEIFLPTTGAFPALDAWWPSFFGGVKEQFGSFGRSLRDRQPSPAVRLVRAKALEPLGRTPDADCAFADQSEPGRFSFGLGWKAHRAAPAAAAVSSPDEGALAALDADFARLCDEGRALLAVTRLAGAFGLRMTQRDADGLSLASAALGALRGLGTGRAVLRRAAPGLFAIDFSASGPDSSQDVEPSAAEP